MLEPINGFECVEIYKKLMCLFTDKRVADWFIAIGTPDIPTLPTVPLAVTKTVFTGYSRLLQCESPSSVIVFSVIRVYGVPTSFGVKKAILPFQ